MKYLARPSAWIQQHYDFTLLASLSLLPAQMYAMPSAYAALLQLGYLSLVSGAILYAKVCTVMTSRVPPTQKFWLVVFTASFVSLLFSIKWFEFAFPAMCLILPLALLAMLYERHYRYRMAKKRIQKRRMQQSRWRVAKRAVLSEWKERLRWLAGVQHDMRQPLHALGLLVGHPSLSNQDQSSEVIRQMMSCQRWLFELAENMLEATRLELGEQREKKIESISSGEMCKSLASWMGHLAETKGLTFVMDVEECPIYTDARRLKRVMGNLVFNAVEHTEEGGVWFSYRRQGGVHRFVIKDTGPGLSQDFLHNSSRESSFGSDLPKSGIGLYVVKRLCQEMEWNLSLMNQPEGGTTFVLELADRIGPKPDAGLKRKQKAG